MLREILLGFVRVHILHHAAEEPFFGSWMMGELASHGYNVGPGTLYPILLSGAAQLLFMNVPPHAAIDLAVRLAQWDPRAKRYDKLVNAVLRRVVYTAVSTSSIPRSSRATSASTRSSSSRTCSSSASSRR